MSAEDFTAALKKGMGRAVLAIQAPVSQAFEDAILAASCEDQRLDRQTEDHRTQYYIWLAERANLTDRLREIILDATTPVRELQRIRFLGYFASQGDVQTRERLQSEALKGNLDATDELIEYGFLPWVLEHILPSMPSDEKWRFRNLESDYPNLTARELQLLKDAESDFQASIKKPSAPEAQREETFESIIHRIQTSEMHVGSLRRIGPNLREDQVRLVAERWLDESNWRRGNNLSKLFDVRDFPLPLSMIVDRVRSGNPPVHFENVLSHCDDPLVRELGLELIKSKNYLGYMTLASSFAGQDYDLLVSSLPTFESLDSTSLHGLCLDLLGIWEKWTISERLPFMVWVYENSPCSYCRGQAAEKLINDGTLPESYWEELTFDADSYARTLSTKR